MNFTKKVVLTYAKSLFQTFKGKTTETPFEGSFNLAKITSSEINKQIPDIYAIGEELLFLRSLLLSSKTISQFFQNPTYSEQKKLDLILSIFPGLTISLQSFLKVLAERSHLSLLPEISEEYTKMLFLFKNLTTVKIITASPLKENSGNLLLNVLKKLTGSKEIILNAFYNPKLLGGLVIEYNSKTIDASLLKEFQFFFNEI
jgi:F-type H+-transporting ATPase subunit delta